jgi:hypothetical protein
MKRILLLCVAIVLLLAIVFLVKPVFHAGYIAEDRKEAKANIDRFHERLARADFDAIYDDADEALKSALSRGAFTANMKGVKTRAGSPQQVTYWTVNVLTDRAPVEVRAISNTTFEKGPMTEMFIYVRRGKDLRLAYYTVSPGSARPTRP